MEEALRAKLLETVALKALVDTRVDWGLRPQGSALPGVALFGVTGIPGMTMTGASGWTRSRVQIDVWGRTYKAARDVADTIAGEGGALVGFRGTVREVRLRTFILGRRTGDDTDAQGPIFRQSIDVLVWHAN
ncbi:conserved hypothetical protein [Sphingomonas aurantiaca]|uniref:DUF3168 domain-containing protein n=1 Tax=Sphingomonas aurantiaca TaxID=185949 RepID=A0A5E7ZSF3_9SPHN|nr:DUF3168 domain-containing protein [Sphingomonas aurantiaca]VVT20318.1 conserved hypothetical protein [Sphingomonas aurantiaca]